MRKREYAYKVYIGMQAKMFAPTVYMILSPLSQRLMRTGPSLYYIVLDEDGNWKLSGHNYL